MTHAISSFFSNLYRDFENQPPSIKITLIAVPVIVGVGCVCYMTVPCCSLLARKLIHRATASPTIDEEAPLVEKTDWVREAQELLDPNVNPTDFTPLQGPRNTLTGKFHKQYWSREYSALRLIIYQNRLWTSPQAIEQAHRCMLVAYAMCKLTLEEGVTLTEETSYAPTVIYEYLEHYQRAREGLYTSFEDNQEGLTDNPAFNPERFYQEGTEEYQWRLWRNEIAELTRKSITENTNPQLWAFTFPDLDKNLFIPNPERLIN
jgi:hypothetical protein